MMNQRPSHSSDKNPPFPYGQQVNRRSSLEIARSVSQDKRNILVPSGPQSRITLENRPVLRVAPEHRGQHFVRNAGPRPIYYGGMYTNPYMSMNRVPYGNHYNTFMRPLECVRHYEEAKRELEIHELRQRPPQHPLDLSRPPCNAEVPCNCQNINIHYARNNCSNLDSAQNISNFEEQLNLYNNYWNPQSNEIVDYSRAIASSSRNPNPHVPPRQPQQQAIEPAYPNNLSNRNSAFAAVQPRVNRDNLTQHDPARPSTSNFVAPQDASTNSPNRPAPTPAKPEVQKQGIPVWLYLEFPLNTNFEEIPDSPLSLIIDEDSHTGSSSSEPIYVPQNRDAEVIIISSDSEEEPGPPPDKISKIQKMN